VIDLRSSRHLRVIAPVAALLAATLVACSSSSGSDTCGPGDQDGVAGGSYAFDLTVTDDAFTPTILKAQNDATVTLTLTNSGTKPHDFVVDCLATPNGTGCPTTSCFPAAATIPAVAPGATATATFVTPLPEGIYVFRSDQPGDAQTGQFIVQ
jgi:hypothetical protein